MNGRHKYNVGDKFDFDGIVEILRCVPLEESHIPKYVVLLPSGKKVIYNEERIDALLAHYSYDSRGVVYIPTPSRELKIDSDCGAGEVINAINSCAYPETPEKFKVGDRVKVIKGEYSSCKGTVSYVYEDNGNCRVILDKNSLFFFVDALEKLPDIIHFDNPMDRQVGGEHYKMPIQPVEFIERNGLGFCVGNCIKYLCRYKKKNGREDLEKARHYIDLLIELEYPEDEKD